MSGNNICIFTLCHQILPKNFNNDTTIQKSLAYYNSLTFLTVHHMMLRWLFLQCTKWLFFWKCECISFLLKTTVLTMKIWCHYLHGLLLLFTSTSFQTTTIKVVSAILSNNMTFSKNTVSFSLSPEPSWKLIGAEDQSCPLIGWTTLLLMYVLSKPTWTVIGLWGPEFFHFPLMRKPTNTPWGKICKLFVRFLFAINCWYNL